MRIPGMLQRHTVTVEAYTGTNSWGADQYAAPATVRGFVDDERRLVRAATGEEVVSEATVYVPLDTVCPVNSRVTLPDGRKAIVLQAKRRDGGGLPTPDHLELALT